MMGAEERELLALHALTIFAAAWTGVCIWRHAYFATALLMVVYVYFSAATQLATSRGSNT